jgi:hypothetical protein
MTNWGQVPHILSHGTRRMLVVGFKIQHQYLSHQRQSHLQRRHKILTRRKVPTSDGNRITKAQLTTVTAIILLTQPPLIKIIWPQCVCVYHSLVNNTKQKWLDYIRWNAFGCYDKLPTVFHGTNFRTLFWYRHHTKKKCQRHLISSR